ncbi:MAG TPA: hypothetical protein VHM16_09285, partial [Rubrobacteraceae bacterium]|nr:hypothetical protein [Rubrobacteraceae bacterium]
PANTAWGTYVRCHDDIGWAITEEDAGRVGLDGPAHRAFLSDYYSGQFSGSPARGAVYQLNPQTGDRRISGTLASLAGLEAALASGDPLLTEMSIRRILLAHAVILGYGGVPLVYMGDETGLLNDFSYLQDPSRKDDNRWMHRPLMDWERAERRREPGTVEERIFGGIRALVEARKRTPHLHAATPTQILDPYDNRVFAFVRPHPLGPLVAVHNFTEHDQHFHGGLPRSQGVYNFYDRISQRPLNIGEGDLVRLGPYEAVWITDGS